MRFSFKCASTNVKGRVNDFIFYIVIFAAALYASMPLFSAFPIPPGYDSVMHFSKIRIFSQFFPTMPRWFPWWYCGTPSLRFYPPLSYFVPSSISWLLKISPLAASNFTDFFSFFLAGLSIFHFMKVVTGSGLSSFSAAIFYMLSPQVLYGRFFIGHFTHNFSMFFIPLTLFVIIKFRDNIKKTALITAPLFSLLFLSHLQTAISLGSMLGIYIFLSLIARWRKEKFDEANIPGLLIGGVLGLFLSSFWLLPALFEGSGKLVTTNEAALRVMFPIQNFFVESGNQWHKQYFLGFPLILMALLSIGLILGRRLVGKNKLWGILFASWTAFFLFTTVSPSVGLVFGWPNRFAHFVSLPMAMLASLAVNWIENSYLPSFRQSSNLKRVARYLILTFVILSVLVHTLNVEQMAFKPYTNEIEATEWLDSQAIEPDERVAAFGTFSYVFNALSDSWQLDGGYLQGQINLDFYYQYWQTLMTSDNADDIFTTLVHTNTRYVVFSQSSEMPSTYLNQTLFDRNDIHGFTIFKLKDNITLNLVEVTHGNASVIYSYLNPDELHLNVRNCSGSITLNVKMNYYRGWTIRSSANNVVLTKDVTGLIKIKIEGVDDFDITLKYDSVLLDHIVLGATITGIVIYLLLLVSFFRRRGSRIKFAQKRELEGAIRATAVRDKTTYPFKATCEKITRQSPESSYL